MKQRSTNRIPVSAILVLIGVALALSLSHSSRAQNGTGGSRDSVAQPSPTPPKPDDEVTLSSDEVVRVETNLTNIFFTAADKQKRVVSTLKKEDVRVLEDGIPQQIFTFQPNSDLPLSLAILIDCSDSEERTLPEEKGAAREFLESVLRADKDEAAVVTFTGEVTLEQGLTGNMGRLRRAIDDVRFVPPAGYIGGGVVLGGTPPISGTQQTLAGSTAIWDAIWATSNELLEGAAEHTRRAIILLTDGQDTVLKLLDRKELADLKVLDRESDPKNPTFRTLSEEEQQRILINAMEGVKKLKSPVVVAKLQEIAAECLAGKMTLLAGCSAFTPAPAQ